MVDLDPVDAVKSYVKSERERWEETKRLGPVGTFKRGLQFGATGPAPSIDEGGGVDFGPEPFGSINKSAFKATGQDPDAAEKDNPLLMVVFVIAVLLLAVTAVGQLLTFEVGS